MNLQFQDEIQQVSDIDAQLRQGLRQIQNDNKAIHFYLFNIYRKVFHQLRQPKCQKNIFLLFYFEKFVEASLIVKKKALHCLLKKNYIQNFKSYNDFHKKSNLKRLLQNNKINEFQNSKMIRILNDLNERARIYKKKKILKESKKEYQVSEFMSLLKQHSRSSKIRSLEQQVIRQLPLNYYRSSLLQRCFRNLSNFARMGKLRTNIKRKRFPLFIKQIKIFNRQDNQISRSFYQAKQKKKAFGILKEKTLWRRAVNLYNYRLTQRYFNLWIIGLQRLQNQKQIQASNQQILAIHLRRREKIVMRRVLEGWRSRARNLRQNKNHNQIVKAYAQAKCREVLQKKYFDILFNNVIHQKVQRFYFQKLKNKTLQSLKQHLISGAIKTENVLEFIKDKQVRKYMVKMKQFVQIEKRKVSNFILKKAFDKFSLKIALNYYFKNQKADQYNQKSLMFKSFYVLKDNIVFRGKERLLVARLNVVAVLRRLRRNFRVRRFVADRNWIKKKESFRGWKLMQIQNYSSLLGEQSTLYNTNYKQFKNQKQQKQYQGQYWRQQQSEWHSQSFQSPLDYYSQFNIIQK